MGISHAGYIWQPTCGLLDIKHTAVRMGSQVEQSDRWLGLPVGSNFLQNIYRFWKFSNGGRRTVVHTDGKVCKLT
jgi:hypothetical protein